MPAGPAPSIRRVADAEAELALLVAGIRGQLAGSASGDAAPGAAALARDAAVAAAEIAVLVRINAQLAPIEAELTRVDIAYQVRGMRFFDRPDVRGAIDLVRRAGLTSTGLALAGEIRGLWAAKLGYDDDVAAGHAGDEARERTAALDTLLDILGTQVRSDARVDTEGYLAELDRRRAAERSGSTDGVNLLTYHRAKGLEWDAVALPALEEGLLPIRHAFDDDELLAEEGRLLYVGITRARRSLAISWAAERETRGRTTRREPSRFLADLRPRGERRITQFPDRFAADQGARRTASKAAAANPYGVADDDPLFAALRAWRTARARVDAVPPYVVAHDQTLAAIAELKPPSAAALRRVKGIGPAKLEAYGDEILELVHRLR
jgi:DNA helicase-2/ATP-dependent DNA helicase PcrA